MADTMLVATFRADHRCFRAGESFSFPAGVALVVGDQGTGKSTLLRLIAHPRDCAGIVDLSRVGPDRGLVRHKDFEKDNPRFQPPDTMLQVISHFASHGEVVRAFSRALADDDDPSLRGVYVLDEPDAALSPRSAHELVRVLRTAAEKGRAVVAAVHNPIVIAAFDDVLSVEHRRRMPGPEFLELHRTTPAPSRAAKSLPA